MALPLRNHAHDQPLQGKPDDHADHKERHGLLQVGKQHVEVHDDGSDDERVEEEEHRVVQVWPMVLDLEVCVVELDVLRRQPRVLEGHAQEDLVVVDGLRGCQNPDVRETWTWT